jgi:catalase
MSADPKQAIETVNQVFGRHPGFRALHAKGALFRGTFKAAPEAAALTKAAHMQGEEIPATFRLSNGAGDPEHPDYAPDPRGFAVKLYLPDESRTDIVAATAPLFPVKNPEGFIDFIKLQSAQWKLPIFLARHPEALRVLPAAAPTIKPPESYATIPYYAIHAFKWIDAQGGERYVRYTILPEGPVRRIGVREAKQRGRDYLQQDIQERVARGPVRFTLELQIAAPGDPTDDPSRGWPKDRQRVRAGTFEITGPETEREKDGDILVFDPTRVVDGIELSDDPVLRFRERAYGESVARRTAS